QIGGYRRPQWHQHNDRDSGDDDADHARRGHAGIILTCGKERNEDHGEALTEPAACPKQESQGEIDAATLEMKDAHRKRQRPQVPRAGLIEAAVAATGEPAQPEMMLPVRPANGKKSSRHLHLASGLPTKTRIVDSKDRPYTEPAHVVPDREQKNAIPPRFP